MTTKQPAGFLMASFLGLAACGGGDGTAPPPGRVSTAFGGDETGKLIQSDGRIIRIGGSSGNFVMARYAADGRLDETFGDHGLVNTDIAGGVDAAFGGALLADGRIMVVGSARVGSGEDFAIARYLRNGAVDTSFGTQGRTTTDFSSPRDRAFAIAIQPDGRIVVAGDTLIAFGNSDFAVARYDADGLLDNTFGGGTGKVTTDIAQAVDIARNVAIESGGTILVSGTITMGSSPVLAHTGIARYSSVGVLDPSFDTSGIVIIPNMQLGDGLALQPDGRILLAGNVIVTGNTVSGVMRLGTNGSPDLDFGFGGLALARSTREARELRLQFDGEAVAGADAGLMVTKQAERLAQ